MKNLLRTTFCILILSSTLATARTSSQTCNADAVKKQLQDNYDTKFKDVPYGQRTVVRMDFTLTLKNNHKINIFISGDDRDILNTTGSDVEVYKTHVSTFTDEVFNAVLVDKASCKIVKNYNITSHYN